MPQIKKALTLQENKILYVSGLAPKQGLGGSIIVYRHLKYLEKAGWHINVLTSLKEKNHLPLTWECLYLPDRRWWWPPVRARVPLSLDIRLYFWLFESLPTFVQNKPTSVLTVLRDNYAPLAAMLARQLDIPLSVIVHDDWTARGTSKNHKLLIERYTKSVFNQATRIWPVSDRLCKRIDTHNAYKVRKLLPIPSDEISEFITWSNEFSKHPTIGYAGNVYPSFLPVLKTVARALKHLGGKLILVANLSDHVKNEFAELSENIVFYSLFEQNVDAVLFLARNCSCILVAHPFEDDKDLMRASFPSKLLEFSAVGLPIMVLAPKDTEISDWARHNQWICYSEALVLNKIIQLICLLKDQTEWINMAKQSRSISQNEFNPATIHKQFVSELPKKSSI